MSTFTYILIPVCTTTPRHVTRADQGLHWFLMVANVVEKSVAVLDSLHKSASASYVDLFQ